MPKRDCQAEIPFQIVAGSDTTATAICSTLMCLMTAPHAYNKLRDEIDEAVTKGTVSSPVTADEGRELCYLQVRFDDNTVYLASLIQIYTN